LTIYVSPRTSKEEHTKLPLVVQSADSVSLSPPSQVK
jgi:hypothetical protein